MTGFERVLVGVDGSEASFHALRQAGRLRAPTGKLFAVTVCDVTLAVHAGFEAAKIAAQLRAEASEVLARVRGELGERGGETILAEGKPASSLLASVRRHEATLVAVGSHGVGRPTGIILGSVATVLLHDAPCSVLVARAAPGGERFPRAIVAALDGSPQSVEALAIAAGVAERFGATLRVLVAEGGKPLAAEGLPALPGRVEEPDRDARRPVPALVDASRSADLLVLGSRGLHGVRALGSVSERVAHEAACSVLVVRSGGSAAAGSSA